MDTTVELTLNSASELYYLRACLRIPLYCPSFLATAAELLPRAFDAADLRDAARWTPRSQCLRYHQ
jgi:hypothetical protein